MRKLVLAIVLAFGVVAFSATPAMAQETTCPGEKYEINTETNTFNATGTNTVTTEDGIVVTLSADGKSATFDLPDGIVSAEVCVKAGSEQSGGGMLVVTVTDGQSVSGLGGHEISHLSIISVQSGGGTTTGGTTTGGTTTGTTTGGGGASGGGGGGGGGSVGTPTAAPTPAGELPFTGFPALVALLAGSALLAGGIAVYRRARHDH